MKRIDFHCDTLTALKEHETLQDFSGMINLQSLRDSDTLLQCFAAFIPTGFYRKREEKDSSFHAAAEIQGEFNRIYRKYEETLEAYSEALMAVRTYDDFHTCEQLGKTGVLLTIEDGGVLGTNLSDIDTFYNQGVRLVTLTWNHENAIAFPNSRIPSEMEKGLKPYGVEAVRYMEEKGIIIDVSHLSDGGFYDVAKTTQKPFVASHSDARAVCPHPRNLTDNMIRIIAERGGIIGLNYYYEFLSEYSGNRSRIEDMVRHTSHIYQVGGEDVLALGSDFDGIDGVLEIAHPTDCAKLAEALKKAGMSERVIEKMWWQNGKRLLKEIL